MGVIKQIHNNLWVETPEGEGIVLLVIDHDGNQDQTWMVAIEKTRKIMKFNTQELKICWNHPIFQHLFKDPTDESQS
jgi:hypothetical protein